MRKIVHVFQAETKTTKFELANQCTGLVLLLLFERARILSAWHISKRTVSAKINFA